MHVSTTTGCYDPGCHSSNLIDGHSGRPAGADFTYQCALCHGPSTGTLTADTRSSAVVAAVASGDTGCDACHSPLPDHYRAPRARGRASRVLRLRVPRGHEPPADPPRPQLRDVS